MKISLLLKHTWLTFCICCAITSTAQKKLTLLTELKSPVGNKSFGSQAWSLGDINGDTFAEVAVYESGTKTLYLFFGTATGINKTNFKSVALSSYNQTPTFSYQCGDVNGDSKNDLIIALPEGKGKLIGYYGSDTTTFTTPHFILEGKNTSGQLGYSFSYSMDVNGDKLSDLVVGEPGTVKSSSNNKGYAYVYYGNKTAFHSQTPQQIDKNVNYTQFGNFVSAANDFNGDGYHDVFITSARIGTIPTAYCFFGGPNGLEPSVSTKQWSYYGATANIGAVGDYNGDKLSDAYIAIDNAKNIINGTSGTTPKTLKPFRLPPLSTPMNMDPRMSCGLPFFTKDSLAEFAQVAMYYLQQGNTTYAYRKVFVYLGEKADTLSAQPYFTYEPTLPTYAIPTISHAPDLNKDGYSDIIVGESFPSDSGAGRVSILKGTFPLQAVLKVDSNRRCFEGNQFVFKNLSNNFAVKSSLLVENQLLPFTGPELTYSFSKPGFFWAKLIVEDDLGNVHSDSLKIHSQPRLKKGNYTLGNDKYFTSIQQLQDSVACGFFGDFTLSVSPGIYPKDIQLINLPAPVGTQFKIWAADASKMPTIAGLLTNNLSNLSVKGIIFNDTNHYRWEPKSKFNAVKVENGRNISFDQCRFHYFFKVDYLLNIFWCNNSKVTNSVFSHYADTTIMSKDPFEVNSYPTAVQVSGDTLVFARNRVYMSTWLEGVNLTGGRIAMERNLITGLNPDGAQGYETQVGLRIGNIQNGGLKMLSNIVRGSSEGALISAFGCKGYNLIANNVIGGDVGDGNYSTAQNGLVLGVDDSMRVYHNTIYYSNAGGTYNGSTWGQEKGFAVYMRSAERAEFKNNLVVASGNNNGCLLTNKHSSNFHSFDNNVYQGQIRSYLEQYSYSDYADISSYATQNNKDFSSFLVTGTTFKSNSELIPTNNLEYISKKVPRLPEVSTDILGNARDSKWVDAGAYALSTVDTNSKPIINLAVADISNKALVLGQNTLRAKITNTTLVPIDSFYVCYKVNRGNIVREKVIAKLKQADTLTYNFKGSLPVNVKRLYKATVWVEIPKNYKDLASFNDTLRKEFVLKMNGEYSVMCPTCEFATLNEANESLRKCGVETQVVFALASGNYSDQLLNVENGPVVYKSATNNAKDVTIAMAAIIDHSKIDIKDLTILAKRYNGATTYGYEGISVLKSDTITFQNVKFVQDVDNKYGVMLGFTNRVSFLNCTWDGFDGGITLSHYQYYGSKTFYGATKISGCTFTNCKNPIIMTGDLSTGATLEVSNNTFTNGETVFETGNYASPAYYNITFNNNTIQSFKFGLHLYGFLKNISIYNNRMLNMSNIPIYLSGDNRGSNADIRIYNNIATVNTPQYHISSINYPTPINMNVAVQLSYLQNVSIFHNTFNGGVYTFAGSNSGVVTKNNIFFTEAEMIRGSSSGEVSDNNLYFRKDGGVLLGYGDYYYTDLTALRTVAPNFEPKSVQFDPKINNPFDLLATNTEIRQKGAAIPNTYQYDIVGNKRNLTTPDLGAYVWGAIVTGLPETSEEVRVKCFPNPTERLLHLTSEWPINRIDVSSIEGKPLKSVSYDSAPTQVQFDMETLPSGICVVQIVTNNGHTEIFKVVKK